MRTTNPFILSFFAVLLAASSVQGGTLTGSFAIYQGSPGYPTLNFTFNGAPYAFPGIMTVGTRTDTPGFGGADALVVTPFDAFCVELGQNTMINQVVTYDDVFPLLGSQTNPVGGPQSAVVTFDATRTLMLGRLWGTYKMSVVDHFTAAAFQMAVWELCFDTDMTLAVGPGLLDANLLTPVMAQAEAWLADIRNLNNIRLTQPLLLITDADLQDMITPSMDPAFSSPEPSTLALSLVAAVGLMAGAVRRRRVVRAG